MHDLIFIDYTFKLIHIMEITTTLCVGFPVNGEFNNRPFNKSDQSADKTMKQQIKLF